MAQLTYWVADWNLTLAEATLELGKDVDHMVDTISATSKADLSFLKDTTIRKLGVYVTGPAGVVWTPGEIAAYRLAGFVVVTIDQRDGPAVLANVGDVESGAKTAAQAVVEAEDLLDRGIGYTVYIDRANLPEFETVWGHTGRPAGKIAAIQWASPTSNPDLEVTPGRTVKQLNVDLSVTLPDWHPITPVKPPAPPPPVRKLVYLAHQRDIDGFAVVPHKPLEQVGFDYATVTFDQDAGPGWGIEPGIH